MYFCPQQKLGHNYEVPQSVLPLSNTAVTIHTTCCRISILIFFWSAFHNLLKIYCDCFIKSINRLVFLMETRRVLCAVGTIMVFLYVSPGACCHQSVNLPIFQKNFPLQDNLITPLLQSHSRKLIGSLLGLRLSWRWQLQGCNTVQLIEQAKCDTSELSWLNFQLAIDTFYADYSFTLKLEAIWSSETLGSVFTTWRYKPEKYIHHTMFHLQRRTG